MGHTTSHIRLLRLAYHMLLSRSFIIVVLILVVVNRHSGSMHCRSSRGAGSVASDPAVVLDPGSLGGQIQQGCWIQRVQFSRGAGLDLRDSIQRGCWTSGGSIISSRSVGSSVR